MKKIVWLLLLGLFTTNTQALPAECRGAEQRLQDYLQALRHHQLDSVRALLVPDAVFRVEWLDNTPSRFFTLKRDDYLQQLKATWHFARNEQLEAGNITWQDTNCTANLTLKESRLILGTATGQESLLTLTLENTSQGWRITRVEARTRTW